MPIPYVSRNNGKGRNHYVALTTPFFCLQYRKTVIFVDRCFEICYINCPDLCEKSYLIDSSKFLLIGSTENAYLRNQRERKELNGKKALFAAPKQVRFLWSRRFNEKDSL